MIEMLSAAFEPLGDPERSVNMSAYMKDHFDYFGIMAGPRRKAQAEFIKLATASPIEDVWIAVEECWQANEREFQYAATDLLRKNAKRLDASDLLRVLALIESKSWWDTVDALATHVVGPIVLRHDQGDVMDHWIDSDNFWTARTAILHQLFYKDDTNVDRLFEYCIKRASDKEFFIRKALGWALRQYSRTDGEAVKAFVNEYSEMLSGLTKREAIRLVS